MIVSNKPNKQKLVLEDRIKGICPQSGDKHGPLVTDSIRGEVLCGTCGAVLVEKVEDSGPEERSYTMEDYTNKSRTGIASSLSLHDKGLTTVIDRKDRDASGNYLSSDMRMIFHRLRTWDGRSKAHHDEKNMKSAFGTLGMLQSKLELSDTLSERAAYIYRKALSKRMTAGRTIIGIMSSSIYAACRELGVPRTLDDIAKAANLTVKELSRDYRLLVNKLDLKAESYDSSEFVTRISTGVGLAEKTRRQALEILHKARQKGITDGRNPISLAAAALYLSAVTNQEEKTQENIAQVSGISSVTIRNVAKILRKNLEVFNHENSTSQVHSTKRKIKHYQVT
jgi:transcription initiation factor TFIIB